MFPTNKLSRVRKGAIWIVFFSALALVGCGEDVRTPEERVAERIEQRYKALIEKDYERVYEFLSPARRQTISLREYQGVLSLREVLAADIVKLECASGDSCLAEVEVTYIQRAVMARGRSPRGELRSVVPERWVYDDGQWWFVLRR